MSAVELDWNTVNSKKVYLYKNENTLIFSSVTKLDNIRLWDVIGVE